ncbi:MAG: hypothetical protein LBE20_06665 [Deltaproteobacteria bacterium]|jgi:hypothetical protein|nr:hypothetical protein [Deltaproteobacteria bacterium]
MKNLFETALDVQSFCLENKWQFCFIGGLALQRWGENRVTQDLNLTIMTGINNEEKFVNALLKKYLSRVDDPLEFALENRIALLKTSNNIAIDISFASLPYEEKLISRASYYNYLDIFSILTCSAEDLIVLKTFAGRQKDLMDVAGVLIKQGKSLDIEYIKEELSALAELREDLEIMNILDKLLKENL